MKYALVNIPIDKVVARADQVEVLLAYVNILKPKLVRWRFMPERSTARLVGYTDNCTEADQGSYAIEWRYSRGEMQLEDGRFVAP